MARVWQDSTAPKLDAYPFCTLKIYVPVTGNIPMHVSVLRAWAARGEAAWM